ncbi:hypothetical protein AJ79_09237 [Helicocarpus griseus UAMH5409]|uniref:Ecp2 effector protein domain-containing protein n=1 Tax=Helicocarpus griseus UAMH5409 TaxID=1447875 RepID=A0A2B7WL49_9EURO|nr:hypothetical protein AJ79_09237 [Helicocarpus griseus UAMH5409]
MLISTLFLAVAASVVAFPATSLDKRQHGGFPASVCSNKVHHKLVGDGKPHQRYKYVQVTTSHTCLGNEDCEMAASKAQGTSTSWSASMSGYGWISGGFEVSKYEETGEVANCLGKAGDVVCVLWRFAHTAYKVKSWKEGCSNAAGKGPDVYMIASPNKDGLGSSYVCGRNKQCKAKGRYFWANFPKAVEGGPQDFPFSAKIEHINARPMENNEDYGGSDAWNRGTGGNTE